MNTITARRRLLALAAGACVWLPLGAIQAQPAANAAPDVLVRALSNDLLEAIRADKTLQTGDIARLNKLIDDKILPYVNFEKMTQLAVGRGWRQASPEQRQTLTREFRQLLVRTYAGAVSQVTDHKIEMKPFRAQPNDTDVLVRTAVVPSRGEGILLDYRLEKTDAGWKIYDVNVAGVWLVENYRSTFSSEINQGGVDGLIKSLTERNRQLAGNK
ncbi:MAG: phospholipid-binding protein MlaC [Betaproteobacteria bacterium]|jgi:phospholipid transport system substrate-binding protein